MGAAHFFIAASFSWQMLLLQKKFLQIAFTPDHKYKKAI